MLYPGLNEQGSPELASWETLPHGDQGLQTPRGLLLGEEPHIIQISGIEFELDN